MARKGISKQQVKEALISLESDGVSVTIDTVREKLGNTGSKTTISRYMGELAEEKLSRMDKQSYVGEKLMMLVSELAKGLNEDANAIVEQAKDRHQTQITAFEKRNQALQDELTASNEHVAALLATISKMEQSAEQANLRINDLELDKARLIEKETSLKTQVKLKNDQVVSLEEKHQHTRASLEHYRESVQTQREQEQTRHESQIQQISSELQKCQNLLSVKQEEISQLSQSLTREKTLHKTTAEQKQAVDALLNGARSELQSIQLNRQSLETTLRQLKDEKQTLAEQKVRLENSLRENVLSLSEMEKQNTRLNSQLETKDSLYKQLLLGLSKLQPSSPSVTVAKSPQG